MITTKFPEHPECPVQEIEYPVFFNSADDLGEKIVDVPEKPVVYAGHAGYIEKVKGIMEFFDKLAQVTK